MLPAAEIQILKRSDGSEWRLGAGGFGTVYKAMRNGVQPVAVKVLGVVSGDRDWGQLWAIGVPGHAALLQQPKSDPAGAARSALRATQAQLRTNSASYPTWQRLTPALLLLFACPAGQQRGGQVDVG